MGTLVDIIRAIRNTRAQYKVESNRLIEVRLYAGGLATMLSGYQPVIAALGGVTPLIFLKDKPDISPQDNLVVNVLKETEVVIPIASMVNSVLEIKRLDKEIAGMEAEIGRLTSRLADPAFLNKAPEAVVAKEKVKAGELTERIVRLREQREKMV